jgi:hypothetical protein
MYTIINVIIIIIIIIIKSIQILGIELDDPGFESRQEQEKVHVSTTCRPNMGPIQHPFHYVLGLFLRGKAAGSYS